MSKPRRSALTEDWLEGLEARLTRKVENRIGNVLALAGRGAAVGGGPFYITDVPTITYDDCRVMKFDCGGGGGQWAFVKEGKASWVETVKYAHREGEDIRICTNFDSLQDDPDLPYLPISITPG